MIHKLSGTAKLTQKPSASFPVDGLLHGEPLVVEAVGARWPAHAHARRHLAPVQPGRLEDHLPKFNPPRRRVAGLTQSGLQLSKVPHFWLSKIPSLCTFSTSNPVQIITDWFMFINISPKRGVRDWLLSRGSAQWRNLHSQKRATLVNWRPVCL